MLFDLTAPEAALAFVTPLAFFLLLLVLHVVLPAWRVTGYIKDDQSGEPVQYRLNGLFVFAVALIVWGLELTGVAMDWLWRAKYWSILSASLLSIVVTLYFVYREPSDGKGVIATLWAGRRLNVVLFNRLEIKMYLYIVGGTVLSLTALSGAVYHYNLHGENANFGVLLYALMWTWFVVDYYCFERVQLYTYDLIHEKLGFKLLWGCFVVYPYLYLIPLMGLVHLPAPELSGTAQNALYAAVIVIFFVGWIISRGSNLQKYTFKRWPEKKFLGLIEPRAVTNGDLRLLASGFWGMSQHINYFGEALIALAMALAFGYFTNIWAWSYFIFILGLFIVRQREDERFCAAKYGSAWEEYKRSVRYRIIPGIY